MGGSKVSAVATNTEDADLHASSDEYARRFSDDAGQWMLSVQEQMTLSLLDHDAVTILDVGGGHGQIAVPLMNAHRNVTVLGSAPACAQRLDPFIQNGVISFKVGNLIEIPFADKSFDTVVCFRLLSHCTQWRQLIREMCRVARRSVILDYPVWTSVNCLSPLLFKLKKNLEGNTRTFTLFSNSEVKREFRKSGFNSATIKKQFFLPMALHRALKSSAHSKQMEGLCRSLGLTHLFGSPVIAKMTRSE